MIKYRRWYNELMTLAKKRELNGYCEKHHINPKVLGGSNDSRNIVKLTYREHFLAHWLLVKIHKGVKQRKMQRALYRMTHSKNGERVVVGWQYEMARRANRDQMLGNQYIKGHKFSLSSELRARISKRSLGNKHAKGSKHLRSPEQCAAISARMMGNRYSKRLVS